MNEYMTVRDIAQLVGKRPVTVRAWRARHGDFPQARATYGATPVFDREEVHAWIRKHHKTAA